MLGIRRIAACVNNNNIAGWLSAWKASSEALGHPWPGDGDPVLRGIRRGTSSLALATYAETASSSKIAPSIAGMCDSEARSWLDMVGFPRDHRPLLCSTHAQ